MRIGIMADTHDNLPMIDKAINRLNEEKVDLVLHAGDYISGFVVPRFKTLNAKLIGVIGNNDGNRELLKKKFSENKNMELHTSIANVTCDGLKIVMIHGDEEELLDTLIKTQAFDVVIYGHSHQNEVREDGKTLVINPGEVCGYLSGKATIALLDTVKREANMIEL